MKVVVTKHFPFGKFVAINMFARLYLKDKDKSRLTLMIRYPSDILNSFNMNVLILNNRMTS